MKLRKSLLAVTISTLLLAACGGGGGSSHNNNPGSTPNQPPRGGNDNPGTGAEQAYLFVSTQQNNPGRSTHTAALRLSDQTLQIISDPARKSQGFNAWINDGTGSLLSLGFMLEMGKLYALDPQTGQSELVANVSEYGAVCRSDSLINPPGEPVAQILLEFSGPDDRCLAPADNIALAFSSDPSHPQGIVVDRALMETAKALLDDRFQRLGFVGLKNQKLVVWGNDFKVINELADSPRGEVIDVTAPGSSGHVMISDGLQVFWALQSDLLKPGTTLSNGQKGDIINHVQDGDLVYYTFNNGFYRANLTTGTHTLIQDLGRSPDFRFDPAQTQDSVITKISVGAGNAALAFINKTTGERTDLFEFSDYDLPPVMAGKQAAFVNDEAASMALLSDGSGGLAQQFPHARWVSVYTGDDAFLKGPWRPVLVKGSAGADGSIRNPQITLYDLDSGAPLVELGTLQGDYTVVTMGFSRGNHLLLSAFKPGETADLYYANLATPNSLKQITATPDYSEYPMLID